MTGVNSATVEPLTNYGVLRAQQDLRGGEAGVSVIATAVNRSLDDLTAPVLHRGAYTTGATFRNRFAGGKYELAGQFAGSYVTGTPAALLLTQTSSVHYFQQPGDDARVDSSRTSLGGHSEQIKFGKYGGGVTRFETSLLRQSAGFEVNDLGYLRRADIVDWSTWGALSFRSARGIYNWAQINGNHWEQWNTSGTRLDNAFNVNGHLGLKTNWDVHLGSTFAHLTPSYCDRCTRGGPLLRQSRGFFPVGRLQLRRPAPRVVRDVDEPVVLRRGQLARCVATVRTSISGCRRACRSTSGRTTRAITTIRSGSATSPTAPRAKVHYSFAHLEQRTVSMSTRVTSTR